MIGLLHEIFELNLLSTPETTTTSKSTTTMSFSRGNVNMNMKHPPQVRQKRNPSVAVDDNTDYQTTRSSSTTARQGTFHTNNIPRSRTSKSNTTTAQSSSQQQQEQDERRIYFLHVGKTGGRGLLFYVLHFRTKKQGSKENALSKRVQGVAHLSTSSGIPIDDATDLLFTIREPISRFESWFQFQSPHNCVEGVILRNSNCRAKHKSESDPKSFERRFYYNCFPTVEDMAQGLDPTYSMYRNRTDCTSLLRDAFETVGGGSDYSHLAAGYRFYRNKVHPPMMGGGGGGEDDNHNNNNNSKRQQRIWAIRMEYFWQDVEYIEHAMGGSEDFSFLEGTKYKYTHGSEHYRDKSGILEGVSTRRVCCALWPEMVAYRDIVENAENLNDAEKRETYQLTWKKCQVSSWEMLGNVCSQLETTLLTNSY
jgi:hypothetical protein